MYIYIYILIIIGDVRYDMYLYFVASTVIEREGDGEKEKIKCRSICFRTVISDALSVTLIIRVPSIRK